MSLVIDVDDFFLTLFMEIIYKTRVFKPIIMAICSALVFGVAIFLIIIIAAKLDMPYMGALAFCAILIIPMIYVKKARAYFMKDVDIHFNNKGLKLEMYGKDKETILKTKQYDWSDLNAFKIYFTQSDYTNLDLYLNGKWFVREISFVDKKENIANDEISVFNLFLFYCFNYNAHCVEEKRIKPRKGFLMTKGGKIILINLLFLDILFIVLMLLYKPNKFPFSFISLIFVITLFIKRGTDKVTYKRIVDYKLPENLF